MLAHSKAWPSAAPSPPPFVLGRTAVLCMIILSYYRWTYRAPVRNIRFQLTFGVVSIRQRPAEVQSNHSIHPQLCETSHRSRKRRIRWLNQVPLKIRVKKIIYIYIWILFRLFWFAFMLLILSVDAPSTRFTDSTFNRVWRILCTSLCTNNEWIASRVH